MGRDGRHWSLCSIYCVVLLRLCVGWMEGAEVGSPLPVAGMILLLLLFIIKEIIIICYAELLL